MNPCFLLFEGSSVRRTGMERAQKREELSRSEKKHWEALPSEILVQIFSYLTHEIDIARSGAVCKR